MKNFWMKVLRFFEMAEADYRFVERYVKFLLWSIRATTIWTCISGSEKYMQRMND